MHSSTSNSNTIIPDANYLKLWGLTFLLVVLILIGNEAYWKSRGLLPSITDDMFLWAYKRSQVYTKSDEKRIVVLGSSRSQLGVVPEVLEQYLPPYKAIHLAVDGHNGYAAFKDLAQDPNFDGILILDITEKSFFEDGHNAQEPWVQYYKKEWSSWSRLEKILNLNIQLILQSRFLIFNSALNPRQLIIQDFIVPPSYTYMQTDRYRPAYYYDRMTEEQLIEHRERRLEIVRSNRSTPTQEEARIFVDILQNQVRPLVEMLRARGGDVIFLRMPTCDEHWDIDNSNYPKDMFWDNIAKNTGAEAIHFIDVKSLSAFECPDASHLDANDAPQFTKNLVLEIGNRNTANLGLNAEKEFP